MPHFYPSIFSAINNFYLSFPYLEHSNLPKSIPWRRTSMQQNDNQRQTNDTLVVSPVTLHRLVEQMEMLQTRLEQLERKNVISCTQSLADIAASYDISPIPSRLSMANAVGKTDCITNLGSDIPSVQLHVESDNASSDEIVSSTPRNDYQQQLVSRQSLLWTKREQIPKEPQPVDITPSTSMYESFSTFKPNADEVTTVDHCPIEEGASSFNTLLRCQTSSLIMSGSTDTVSTEEAPNTSHVIHISPLVVSSDPDHDVAVHSVNEQLSVLSSEFGSPTMDARSRQPTVTSFAGATRKGSALNAGYSSPPQTQKQNYGRCYSSFFPATLLGSSTFSEQSVRHSLATSLRELAPMFTQSGSCLNLQDHVEIVADKFGSSMELKALPKNPASNHSLPNAMIRATKWFTGKLAAPPKMKSSVSAPVLNGQKQSMLSRKWFKLRGRM